MQGLDSDTEDLDLDEIYNTILGIHSENVEVVVGVNRDLLMDNQKQIHRDHKANNFDLVFQVDRNEAGYNARDVHG